MVAGEVPAPDRYQERYLAHQARKAAVPPSAWSPMTTWRA